MAPAPHTTAQRLQELRLRLATVQRAYNPNQPRDGRGRFGSTGTHALPSVSTEAEAHQHATAIAHAGGAHSGQHQCAWCSRMTTGPMAGKRLGFVLRYGNWSHGICKSCNRRMMVPYYMSKGFSEQDAEKWVDLVFHGKATAAEALAAMQHNNGGGEQRAMYAQFAERLRPIQIAVDQRFGGLNGRVPLFALGADGKMHFAGSTAGDGSVHFGWEGVTHASAGTGKSRGGGTTGKSGGAKPVDEDIHATARRLQQEQGLPAEVAPAPHIVPGKVSIHDTSLVPITHADKYQFDPAKPPDPLFLKDLYGEHQLGAALYQFTTPELRRIADEQGLTTTGIRANHAALVSAITAHATEGRYSADFRTAGRMGAKSEFDSRGIHRKLTNEESAAAGRDHERMMQALRGDTGVVAPNGVPLGEWDDPQKLWTYAHGDIEHVYRLITMYPQLWGMHEFIKQDPRFADIAARFKGFSRNATAQEMTEALDRHFNGNKASWGRNGRAAQTTSEHPDLEPYRRELARLHQQYRDLLAARPDLAKQLEAHQKAAASGKATGSKGKKSGLDFWQNVKPLTAGEHPEFSTINPNEPFVLHRLYGDDQFRAIVEHTSGKTLRDMATQAYARFPGTQKPNMNDAAAMRQYILDAVMHPESLPKATSATKTAGGAGKAKRPGDIQLTPIRQLSGYTFEPDAPANPRAMRTIYGDDQLKQALNRYPTPRLSTAFREYLGTVPPVKLRGESAATYKSRLVNLLSQWAMQQPLMPIANTQRATLADLAARLHAITTTMLRTA